MTREDIIRMAREAGIEDAYFHTPHPGVIAQLERFASLVAAAEREACAKVAAQISDKYGWGYYGNEVDTADEIAAAIRARGQA
jgi:hypothetical protein